MEEKIYRCIAHGIVPKTEVEFGPETLGEVTDNPNQEVKGVTARHRYHKNCCNPVEVE